MRVTSNTFPTLLTDQLGLLSQRQNQLQNQAATGQRVQLPEDDPAAMRRILDLQGESVRLSQYRSNIQQLMEYSQVTYGLVNSLKSVVDRGGEIATLADGTRSQDQLDTYANEVSQMLEQALHYVNSQHRGDYLFSGTRNQIAPFTAVRDANGEITAITYQGNTEVASAEIAENVTVSTMTLGQNDSGSGTRGLIADNRFGADFFNHLIALRDNLRAGDTDAIANTNLAELGKDEDNLLVHIGSIGAIQARLEAAQSVTRTRSQSVESLVSQEADADLAQTLVHLSETQTAYQAALQSGATILSQSLLDYIR